MARPRSHPFNYAGYGSMAVGSSFAISSIYDGRRARAMTRHFAIASNGSAPRALRRLRF